MDTKKPSPNKKVNWIPKDKWQQLGVYRTFPLPLTPPPPFTPRVKWTNPMTGKTI